jgi:hypothetical protein
MILYAEVKPGHAFLEPGNWLGAVGRVRLRMARWCRLETKHHV